MKYNYFLLVLFSIALNACSNSPVEPEEIADFNFDYFPITVGNSWEYEIRERRGGSSGYINAYSGIQNIKIININYEDSTFELSASWNGRHIFYDRSSETDTTFFSDSTTTKVKIKNKLELERIEDSDADKNFGILGHLDFIIPSDDLTYNIVTYEDTKWSFQQFEISFKKNVGLINYSYEQYSVALSKIQSLELISYTVAEQPQKKYSIQKEDQLSNSYIFKMGAS